MSLLKLTPELVVTDVEKSVDFYVQLLGFEKIEGDPHFARLRTGSSEIFMFLKTDFDQEIPNLNRPQNSGWVILNIETSDIQTIFEKVKDQVSIVRPFKQTAWGTTEFTFTDPDGYLVQFTQRLEV